MSPENNFLLNFRRCIINFCLDQKFWFLLRVICGSLATIFDFSTLTVSMVILMSALISTDHHSETTNGSTNRSGIFSSTAWAQKLPLGGLEKVHGRFPTLSVQCAGKGTISSWLWAYWHWSGLRFPACIWRFRCRSLTSKFVHKLPASWKKKKNEILYHQYHFQT